MQMYMYVYIIISEHSILLDIRKHIQYNIRISLDIRQDLRWKFEFAALTKFKKISNIKLYIWKNEIKKKKKKKK